MMTVGGCDVKFRRTFSPPRISISSVMDDLDDLLARAQALHDFLAKGLLLHGIRELLHDFEIHVGFEQGDTDFLQRFVEVLLQ